MKRLVRVGGTAVDLARAWLSPGSATVIPGNFQGYSNGGAYQAWDGMWGASIPANDQLAFTNSLTVHPKVFPHSTSFDWNITQTDPDWAGVNGFLFVAYGNYDDSAGVITPKQVSAINDLTVTTTWTFTGDPASGLLCEHWLSAAPHASGGYAKTHEISFQPKMSLETTGWAVSLPAVGTGSFVDANGATWTVKKTASNGGATPYYVAYRPGAVDHHGDLCFADYLRFLVTSGELTGNEWFNGVAFGVEPRSGQANLSIDYLRVTYD